MNTSLNVGTPIAQTPTQALQTLKRAKGLHGLFLVSDDGHCLVAWHDVRSHAKDEGGQLRRWIDEWRSLSSAVSRPADANL